MATWLLCSSTHVSAAQVTVTKGHRTEGAFINKSLLTLGTVIAKLSEGGHAHIPFRPVVLSCAHAFRDLLAWPLDVL
jgi:hypothetical protein